MQEEHDELEELLHIYSRRADILEFIADDVLDKRLIDDQLDVSRPTIDRAFRELEGAGILASTGSTYELTKFGDLFCQQFLRTREVLRAMTDIRPALEHLPRDEAIDMRLLRNATIHRAETHAPQEPFLEIANLAYEATELVGYSSTVMPYYVDVFHTLIVDEEIPATLVFTADVVDTLRENYSEKFEDLLHTEHASVVSTPVVKSYGLLMSNDTVAVPIGDERDTLQAVILNDSEAALEWGEAYLSLLTEPADATEL